MGIRDTLNQYRLLAATMAVLGPTVLIYFVLTRFSRQAAPVAPTTCFYTIDDGKTVFAGPIDHPRDFQHDGQTPIEAGVFTCDGGSHQWVAYLRNGQLVKRPGDAKWISQRDPQADQILNVKCPDGTGLARPVWP